MDLSEYDRDIATVEELTDHGGLSGAELQRATCHDGRTLIVKRSSNSDLFARLLGGDTARELRLWERGVFAELPPQVGHTILGGWTDATETVVLMDDLGDRIRGMSPPLTDIESHRVVAAVTAMHRKFSSRPPDNLAPLGAVITTFAPDRLAALGARQNDLVGKVRRGWVEFERLTPPGLSQRVHALLRDPEPLVAAFAECTPTLCHGDLAPVNFAWSPQGGVVLIDWSQAVAAPAEFDIARFALGCGSYTAHDIATFLDEYEALVGSDFDPVAMDLALLAALIWFGWGKALAIVDTDVVSGGQRPAWPLEWWVRRAEAGFALL